MLEGRRLAIDNHVQGVLVYSLNEVKGLSGCHDRSGRRAFLFSLHDCAAAYMIRRRSHSC